MAERQQCGGVAAKLLLLRYVAFPILLDVHFSRSPGLRAI
jgi:hypothetical protein